MKNFILVLFSAFCVACSVARQAAPSEKIITETRIETVFQTDTVFLEVPKIVEKIVTADTVSVLENDYAMSSASVSDGLLSHSLETKPAQQPVEVQTKIVYRDRSRMRIPGIWWQTLMLCRQTMLQRASMLRLAIPSFLPMSAKPFRKINGII